MSSDLIVSNLLCFLHSSWNDYDQDALHDIIVSFYSPEDIVEAKETLFKACVADIKHRRGNDKVKRDITDILETFDNYLKSESSNFKFVSNSYKLMPPSGLDTIAHTLSSLFTELSNLRVENKNMMSKLSIISDHFSNSNSQGIFNTMIQEDINSCKLGIQDIKQSMRSMMRVTLGNEIGRLSQTSVLDSLSVPGGKTCVDPIKDHSFSAKIQDDLSDVATACCLSQDLLGDVLSDEVFNHHPSAPMLSQLELDEVNTDINENKNQSMKTYSSKAAFMPKEVSKPSTYKKQPTIVVRNNKLNNYIPRHKSVDSEGYTKHVSRRKVTTGTKKSFDNISFKSANRYIDLYLGRCESTCNTDTVINYLKSELKVTPIECIMIETKVRFSTAFKITVDVKDKDSLFEPSSWPDGVICRKFFSSRNNT